MPVPIPPVDPSGYYTAASNNAYWITTTGATTYPNPNAYPYGTVFVGGFQPPTEWEQAKAKADIKAEPEDEFSWLRRRVREVEDLAFT